MVETLFLQAAAFGALAAGAMTLCLFALRHVDWELIPRSALRRVRWWQRHAQTFLIAGLVITTAALATVAVY